jgi:hypothetical protein
MDAGDGISMDFHRFTASHEENHLALDIKDYISYLETRFPDSYELDDFVWRSGEALRKDMTNFDFVACRADIKGFENWLAVWCRHNDRSRREDTELYREAVRQYGHYLSVYAPVDFMAFKAAREKQAKEDRLILSSEDNPDCDYDYCGQDFDNFDRDSFSDTSLDDVDVDVDVLFSTSVHETHDPNLYDEDSDDSDDTILNEQWEANKPGVPFSDYTKSIWHSPVPADAYELLADLEDYKKHYLAPPAARTKKRRSF